jgi:hypothetical protein
MPCPRTDTCSQTPQDALARFARGSWDAAVGGPVLQPFVRGAAVRALAAEFDAEGYGAAASSAVDVCADLSAARAWRDCLSSCPPLVVAGPLLFDVGEAQKALLPLGARLVRCVLGSWWTAVGAVFRTPATQLLALLHTTALPLAPSLIITPHSQRPGGGAAAQLPAPLCTGARPPRRRCSRAKAAPGGLGRFHCLGSRATGSHAIFGRCQGRRRRQGRRAAAAPDSRVRCAPPRGRGAPWRQRMQHCRRCGY